MKPKFCFVLCVRVRSSACSSFLVAATGKQTKKFAILQITATSMTHSRRESHSTHICLCKIKFAVKFSNFCPAAKVQK